MGKLIKLKMKCLKCGKIFESICDENLYSYYKYLKSYKIDCKFTQLEHGCTNGQSNSSSILILDENTIEKEEETK